ncbi:helix-turn-helix domain-containing transcriptional regulator [Burkholderia phage Mica]|uniref:Helix-turn-helix domain-containing transcriptional regulator n=1 Tax=Burkholderia phage Mica TaxID=2767579 RepID=A0A873WI60_9CAUD|nr:helix-turn-helix domain-containing transcriptional regulator [Burkholderia phage Mica]QPB08652.1 helix-turn-helix domain-containing transcriptional regulator [Burkholderia phage Mica]
MPIPRGVIVSRLVLALVKKISCDLLHDDRFGTRADDVVLCCAIFIGLGENKPMTASKLAEYAGMPRPTVIRKLRELESAGLVRQLSNKRVILVGDMVGTEAARVATDVFTQIINSAAKNLSKLDSAAIAGRRRRN